MLDQTTEKEHFKISMMLPSRNNLKTFFYLFFVQSTTNCNVGPSINDVTIFSWLLHFFLLRHCLQCWASQKYTNKTVMIIGGFDFEWYYHFFLTFDPSLPHFTAVIFLCIMNLYSCEHNRSDKRFWQNHPSLVQK